MWAIYLITWIVMCPLGENLIYKGHEVKIQQESVTNEEPTYTDKNIIECPEHHIALFAKAEKWEFVRRDGMRRMR